MNGERTKSFQRQGLPILFAAALLVLLVLPHLFLPIRTAWLITLAVSLIVSGILVRLLRQTEWKVKLGMGAYFLLALLLTSASCGVFFYFPFLKALLWFGVISVSGALILTILGIFLVVRVLPESLIEDLEH